MPKVKPTCVLSETEGEKPRTALYTCSCGGQFEGLKAWREHMVARSQLRKRARRRAGHALRCGGAHCHLVASHARSANPRS